ncbi:MAG: FAD-dependent oxidoreductase [Armatimonadetes bacterium]|nr:FAD-dependent oxidoreductase [Armatimonadota bacterium]
MCAVAPFLLLCCAALPSGAVVLVEAESFADPGGWVVDPQFMDQMGSPYLLAHGLGRPVADATTQVDLPGPGTYHVWVRSYDWVARWQAPGTPGRFQVLVNGQPLEPTFGTVGAAWHWQSGGSITVTDPHIRLALHDLTGFEGRCDAIAFSPDADWRPPNADPAMAQWRRQCLGQPEQPESAGTYDLVVVGGGLAGTCAAIAAARGGLKTALIQDRPMLGGNNSSEVRVWLQGARNKEPWPRIGDVVSEMEPSRRAHYGPTNTADLYEDDKKLAVAAAEPNLRLVLDHRANAVVMAGRRIAAVVAQDTHSGRRLRFDARLVADCTGDGAVGALAGADLDMSPAGRMGPCNLWNVKDRGTPQDFPRCPWALDLSDKPFPGRNKDRPDPDQLGGWYWESGFSRHPIDEMEYIRDWNFRAMYGAWDALRNVDKVLPNHALNWSAHILGKRESRRLMGDVVLTVEEIRAGRQYPDGCVPTGWSIDLHYPDERYQKGFEGDEFIARASHGTYPMPFWIPYRCLYSRNVDNLFMAGRDISVTHEALGPVRVMRTGGCMGEVVGLAATLCREKGIDPRAVWAEQWPAMQAKLKQGAGKNPGANPEYDNQGEGRTVRRPSPPPPGLVPPAWLAQAGANLARAATLTVSGSREGSSPALLNDGRLNIADNGGRWLSDGKLPLWVELTWPEPQKLGAARIVSGYLADGAVTDPLGDFRLQWHDGTDWHDIADSVTTGNTDIGWAMVFAPVTTTRLRLLITGTKTDTARVWELEVYG